MILDGHVRYNKIVVMILDDHARYNKSRHDHVGNICKILPDFGTSCLINQQDQTRSPCTDLGKKVRNSQILYKISHKIYLLGGVSFVHLEVQTLLSPDKAVSVLHDQWMVFFIIIDESSFIVYEIMIIPIHIIVKVSKPPSAVLKIINFRLLAMNQQVSLDHFSGKLYNNVYM